MHLSFPPVLAALPILALLSLGCGASATGPAESPDPKQTSETASPSDDTQGEAKPETSVPKGPAVANGSRVSLWLPADVKRFSRALMFRNEDASVVVVVGEMSAPEGKRKALVRGVIEGAEGLEVESDETRDETRSVVLAGQRNGKGARMRVLQQGGAAATVYVVTSPGRNSDAHKILDSATLDATRPLDPLAIHGLKLDDLGDMEVMPATHQPVMLKRKDQTVPVPATSAIAFIGVTPHPFGPEMSDQQLSSLVAATIGNLDADLAKAKTNPIQIDDQDAREFIVKGEKDGKPLAIYTYALKDGPTAIIAVAYVQADRADQELADVVPLLRSLEMSDDFE